MLRNRNLALLGIFIGLLGPIAIGAIGASDSQAQRPACARKDAHMLSGQGHGGTFTFPPCAPTGYLLPIHIHASDVS